MEGPNGSGRAEEGNRKRRKTRALLEGSARPTSGPVARRRVAAYFILVLCLASTSSVDPAVELELDKEAGGGCDPASEFTCPSERSCIPIEWRCDFTEQCLDGRDESGCLSEWCDFEHNLCNLSNELASSFQRRVIWRRFFAPVKGESEHESWSPLQAYANQTTKATISRLNQALEQVALRANELSGAADEPRSAFLLAPFSLARQAGEPVQDRQLIASLKSPLIGQTNSMCHLRFKYSMWLVLENEFRSHSSSSLSNQSAPISSDKLATHPEELKRFAHHTREGQQSVQASEQIQLTLSVSVSHEQLEATKKKTLWSRSLYLSPKSQQFELQMDERKQDWSIGAVDLGHLRQVKIELAAQVDWAGQVVGGWPQIDDKGLNRSQVHAFVLIDWLILQGCAWPQGGPKSLIVAGFEPNTLGVDSTSQEASERLATNTSLHGNSQMGIKNRGTSSACSLADQFECSNGLCIATRRLCNFVDDCMTDHGQNGLRSSATLDGNDLSFSEDESSGLCQGIPGRLNYEPLKCKTCRQSDGFWSLLDAHWPKGLISIQNGLSHKDNRAGPRPRFDHTFRNVSGHYLNLELPTKRLGPGDGSSLDDNETVAQSAMTNVYWIYIRSLWLRKSTGQCRLKFFYNLVDSENLMGSNGSMLYLAIEHFKLDKDPTDSSRVLGVSRSLDYLASSRPLSSETRSRAHQFEVIPLAGVDFWREVNVQLEELREGDIFFTRIALIVDLNEDQPLGYPTPLGATLNIDDLSTHFGCQSIEEQPARWRKYLNQSSLELDNFVYRLALDDSVIDWLFTGRRNRKLRALGPGARSDELEPKKLIICVFGVLLIIMSIILVIVFIIVPYVEQITMNYHDQLAMGLSQLSITTDFLSYRDSQSFRPSATNATNISSMSTSTLENCELTGTESDWEQLSRHWRHSPMAHFGSPVFPGHQRPRAASKDNVLPVVEKPSEEALTTGSSSDSALPQSDED